MKPGLVRLVAVAALVVALVAAFRWWRSDARRIEGNFDRLLAAVEKSGEESHLDRLGRAGQFAELFARDFVVTARPYEGTIADRQQLMGILDRYRTSARRIAARGVDRELELRDNGTADLFAVVELDGSGPGGPGRERFRLRLTWVLEDGEWRIGEAEIVERLETSGLFG